MKRSIPMTAALTCVALAVTISVTLAPRVSAQTAAANATFDVASVKPNKSGDGRVMLSLPPTGRLTATNVPLRLLLRTAFDVQDFQIVGGPNWIASDRFDITAKAPDGVVAPEQIRPMLRALLADRFKLVVHNETREMPIYALVMARPDGKFGPNLKVNPLDCEAVFRAGRGGAPPPPPQPGEPIQCGFMIGPGTMTAGGMQLADLARSLSQFVGGIVVDKTGLKERLRLPVEVRTGGSRVRSWSGAWRRRAAPGRSQSALALHGAAGAARAQARVPAGAGRCRRHRSRRTTHRGLSPCFDIVRSARSSHS